MTEYKEKEIPHEIKSVFESYKDAKREKADIASQIRELKETIGYEECNERIADLSGKLYEWMEKNKVFKLASTTRDGVKPKDVKKVDEVFKKREKIGDALKGASIEDAKIEVALKNLNLEEPNGIQPTEKPKSKTKASKASNKVGRDSGASNSEGETKSSGKSWKDNIKK